METAGHMVYIHVHFSGQIKYINLQGKITSIESLFIIIL